MYEGSAFCGSAFNGPTGPPAVFNVTVSRWSGCSLRATPKRKVEAAGQIASFAVDNKQGAELLLTFALPQGGAVTPRPILRGKVVSGGHG